MAIPLAFGLATLLGACGPNTAPSASPSSIDACPVTTTKIGDYVFGGALGVQSGPLASLRANEPPRKVMFANRAPTPPREMTIRARPVESQNPAASQALPIRAGWAPTRPDQTFSPIPPVLGYVSEIPTLSAGGCWELSWNEGTATDRIVVRVLP